MRAIVKTTGREWMLRDGFVNLTPESFYSDVLNEDLQSPKEVADMFEFVADYMDFLSRTYRASAKRARQ